MTRVVRPAAAVRVRPPRRTRLPRVRPAPPCDHPVRADDQQRQHHRAQQQGDDVQQEGEQP
ncbi:hypothetical protein ACWD6Z_21230, partial [Streptomyces californicus]